MLSIQKNKKINYNLLLWLYHMLIKIFSKMKKNWEFDIET